MKTTVSPGVAIKGVKRLSFYVNENIVQPGTRFQSELSLQFGFSIESNLLDFTVNAHFLYADTKESLARISVRNLYAVPNLKRYFIGNTVRLPVNLLLLLVDMSISHTRALFASDLSGTKLNDNPIPIVDAENLAKHFFPAMFKDSAPVKTGKIKKAGKKRI